MKHYAIIAALVLCVGYIVHQDYKAELEEQRIYCENVSDGTWPDYQGNFKVDCKQYKQPTKKKSKYI